MKPARRRERNIWIYTPERYMSYTDKNPNQKFDFVFIDEGEGFVIDYIVKTYYKDQGNSNVEY